MATPVGGGPSRTAQRHPVRDMGVEQPRWLVPGEDDAPPRPALTRRRIVLTALALVEKHGLDALTMRRVASELDVTPMSLYNHVADKAELVDLMVDFIIGNAEETAPMEGTWEERLRAQCKRNYEVWKAHPGIVRVYAEGVNVGPNGLAALDHAIGILREAGFNDEDAGSAVMLLYRWSMSTLLVGRTRPVRRDQQRPRNATSKTERMDSYFAALSPESIPNIEATAMYLSGTSIDFGLDVVLAGLRERLKATQAALAQGAGQAAGPASDHSTTAASDPPAGPDSERPGFPKAEGTI